MSILDKITKITAQAPRITIYGKPGIGKTTLASQFPEPLFLLTENPSIEGIRALPVAHTFDEFWENVKELLAIEEPPFKTLVIDSVSKLDALIVKYILNEEKANKDARNNGERPKITTLGAACGGYGKGYERAQGMHRAIKSQLDKFTKKDIAVVFISHVAVTKHRSADSEDFDIFSIVMNHDKSREVYIDDVDAVLFGRQQSFTETLDSGKNIVKSTKNRALCASVNDVNVSKNRFSMPDEIPMDFNELKKYIPFYNQHKESE